MIPKLLCSGNVYLFKCSDCGIRYVGSSIRNMKVRIYEHKGFSFRTNRVLSNPVFSEIREHSNDYDHVVKGDNFRITGECSKKKT